MTSTAQFITTLLSLGVVIADIVIIVFAVFLIINPKAPFAKAMFRFFGKNALVLSFGVTMLTVLGSLYYSDVVGFAPCDLCWWQRIFMYPQAVIFGIALLIRRKGKSTEDVFRYSAGLSLIGLLIAAFHFYGQTYAESILPCQAASVSCAKIYFISAGYVTIPVMSLTSFLLLIMFILSRKFINEA